jgi:hypothetical protein
MAADRFGNAWMRGVPHDHQRTDRRVLILSRAPLEPDVWRVRFPDGTTGIASGSMLQRDK